MMYVKIGEKQAEAAVHTRYGDQTWGRRDCKVITVSASVMGAAEAAELFTDGATWSLVGGDGTESDMSAYGLAGPITDNRDGTVTVKMGKYTAAELAELALGGVPADRGAAQALRGIVEELAQGIEDDAVALQAKTLYPLWQELADKSYTAGAGFRFRYGNALYKTLQADSTFAAHYVPGMGTEALYEIIDETHAGTVEDPIPYGGNMALVTGVYYIQGGVLYRCTRDTESAVYGTLAELVGLYVEVA